MRRSRAALPTVGLLLAAGCGGPDAGDADPDAPLLVMAAASLNRAMPDLTDQFRAASGTEIDVVLGATGSLAAQIEHGAPGDVFLSADEATVRRLAERGLVRAASVRPYAVGRLVVVWRPGVPRPASAAALEDPAYRTVAMANPEHAPYGAAAREALRALGIWEAVEPRIVLGENVAQAWQFVRTGNADAALVARSVVDPGATDHALVDGGLHEPVLQVAGVLARSGHPAAAVFLDFVTGPEGRTILAGHGFDEPGPR